MSEEHKKPSTPDRPNNLSSQEAIDIISPFLSKEWKFLKPEHVDVVRLQTGFNNQVYVVSNNKTVHEPKKVVIRKYGGFVSHKKALRPSSHTQELLCMSKLSSLDLSPKLHGFFDEGRIEEFVDSHNMSEEEAFDPLLESDLAKNLARFHAVNNLPLPKPGYDFRDVLREHFLLAKDNIHKVLSDDNCSRVHAILKNDWESELDFLSALLEPENHRIVFMHWDTHLHNIGIRNNPTEGQLKTILYDYEMSNYNIRGKDIGLFFLSRSGLHASDMSAVTQFPPIESCESFIQEYMKECRLLFQDWDETSVDSHQHILKEAIIGGMVSCFCFLFSITGRLAKGSSNVSVVKVPSDYAMTIIKRVYEGYISCKKQLSKV